MEIDWGDFSSIFPTYSGDDIVDWSYSHRGMKHRQSTSEKKKKTKLVILSWGTASKNHVPTTYPLDYRERLKLSKATLFPPPPRTLRPSDLTLLSTAFHPASKAVVYILNLA